MTSKETVSKLQEMKTKAELSLADYSKDVVLIKAMIF
jgi:hypothetical protein